MRKQVTWRTMESRKRKTGGGRRRGGEKENRIGLAHSVREMRTDEEIKLNNEPILPNIWCIGSMRYAAAEELADARFMSAEAWETEQTDRDTICRRAEVGRGETCLGFLGNFSGNVPW